MSSFSLPTSQQPLLSVGQTKLSAAICYEIAYPELVRTSSSDADMLLTVSNDTWFGRSIAPAQHLQIARVRAVENGRWVIRGTNNGITALINAQGAIVQQLPQFQSGVLRGTAQGMQGQTPYQQYGALPVLLLALILTLIPLGKRRKRDNRERYPNFR
jgi:apolipoprotein N-acyltransferase